MALYRYTGVIASREDFTESGTVLAQSEAEAKQKLKAMKFDRVSLKKVKGLKGLFGAFTATVR